MTNTSPKIQNVAEFILSELGPMSTMKLQKLCYFSQGWSLAWTSLALFPEEFQAWANGPVCRDLYTLHRGEYSIETLEVEGGAMLTREQRKMIRAVLKSYGKMSGFQLSQLTHKGKPWKSVRDESGLRDGDRSNATITKKAMKDYFQSL